MPMKPFSTALLALSFGCLLSGACERHSFEETRALQELQRPHGDHGEGHDKDTGNSKDHDKGADHEKDGDSASH